MSDAGTAIFNHDITLSDNGKAIFGAGSDLQIYHDGSSGHSIITESGSGALQLQGENLVLEKPDGTNYLLAVSGASGYVKLYQNGSEKLATTSTGVQVTGNITNASGDLTIDVAGEINIDADGAVVNFQDGGTTFGLVTQSSSDFVVRNPTLDKDIVFKGNDGGVTTTALTLDMSQAGRATFNEGIVLKASTGGDFGVNINTASGDSMKLQVVDTGSAGAANGVITVTDGDLILSPSANVGIGTSSPSSTLAVETGGIASLSSYAGHIVVGPSSRTSSSGDYSAGILFDQANGVQASGKKGASITGFQDGSDVNSMGITFNVHGTDGSANRFEAMRLDASGNLLLGTTSAEGVSSNSKKMIAGHFTTKNGVTTIANTGVATTLMTFGSNEGNFLVSAVGSGTGSTNDNTTGIIHVNNSATTYTALAAGSGVVLSMSGLNLQVTQSIFNGANITWSVMKLR